MTAVIRRKTWEERREEKISAEYVRLSEENRQLRADLSAYVEQLQALQMRVATVSEILKEVQL